MEHIEDIFNRTERLIGSEGLEALSGARVILFGLGGVGSWCAEALVRSGVGHLTIVDADRVAVSNINRQLPALVSTSVALRPRLWLSVLPPSIPRLRLRP